MPTISMFYGIIIYMYNELGAKHKQPHIHAFYGDSEAVFDFEGNVLQGQIPVQKTKLVSAWIEIHKEDLIADWHILQSGNKPLKIEPLK